MRHICALVCSNGLGHFRRIVQIISGLIKFYPEVYVDIICAKWQLENMSDWQAIRELKATRKIDFKFMDLYIRWSISPEYYNGQLLIWHRILESLKLDSYDLVLSDNLVEALIYRPDAILSGSFLWHDIYEKTFPQLPLIQEYSQRSQGILKERYPLMIANQDFVMPAVRELTQTIEAGMFPAAVKFGLKEDDGILGILFVGSSAVYSPELIQFLMAGISDKEFFPVGICLSVNKTLAKQLPASKNFNVFDYEIDDFNRIDAIVARPGMGVITDSLVTGTPLFCFYDSNPEVEHNMQMLASLGLGWKLDSFSSCFEKITSFFSNSAVYKQYQNRVAKIDKDGLEKVVKILMSRLN